MAWLWPTWQEYIDAVQPVSVTSRGLLISAKRHTLFEVEQLLGRAVGELEHALEELRELGYTGNDFVPPEDPELLKHAHGAVVGVIHAGEELLLYHRRLAADPTAYGFLSQHELLAHWDRYAAGGRITYEISQLVDDSLTLLAGYRSLVESDTHYIVDSLKLPEDLAADFLLARNLFSVGLEDVGLLIAGRGLEYVLRKIAVKRKITLNIKGIVSAASEADTYDLIEAMFRLRWKTTGVRLISSDTKALLHYLRSLRNEGAHASSHGSRRTIGPRETAAVVAETANHIWGWSQLVELS